MKKHLLLFILFLFFALSGFAGNLYWVGGSGSWNDVSHWSNTSDGTHGTIIPTANDDVFFDGNSFNWGYETVQINGTVSCKNLIFTNNVLYPIINGAATAKWNIYGSLSISSSVKNNFFGSIYFKSSHSGNTIDIDASGFLQNDVYFDNPTGFWSLSSPLVLKGNHSLNLLAGNFSSNGNLIDASAINAPANAQNKKLSISNSTVCLATPFSESANLSAYNDSHTNFSLSRIFFGNSTQSNSFVKVTLFNGNDSIHIKYKSSPCSGQCNAEIITTAVYMTGGVGPYVYTWQSTPYNIGDTVKGACDGQIYTFSVKDNGNGQIHSFSITLPPIPPLVISSETFKNITCFGDCDGGVAITYSGGTGADTYSWSSGQTTASIANLCIGTYTITTTDANGCTATSSATLAQPPKIIPNATFTNVTCNGFCNGTATCAPTGGHNAPYTYSWSNGQTTQSISNLCPGTYTITVKDDSLCTGTATVTITQPNKLIITPSSSNVKCFGVCDGIVSVAPVSGGTTPYTYSWTPNTVSGTGASNLCVGVYSVTVTDANGCTATASFNITQPAQINPNATRTNVKCFGSCTGTATAAPTGGTGTYTYSWAPGAQTTSSISALCPGTYTITVTDANGCTGTQSVTITQPSTPIKDSIAVTKITCNGSCNGSLTAIASGGTPGYTYSWLPGGQTTPTISALCAGTYTITVKDANGCTTSQSITLIPPPALVVNPTGTNVTCNGNCNGTAAANASGGTGAYTYSWSPGAQTTSTLSGLCAGTYSVTVTDANGCTQTGKIKITQPNPLTVGLTPSPATIACNGNCNASIASIVNGGTAPYNYSWSPGSQTTSSISSLCAGTYSLTVTDANGCTQSTSVTINQSPALLLSTTNTPPSCNGKCDGTINAIASGGTGAYTYSWSPGGQTSATINNLCAGTYKVYVKDANACKDSATITIVAPIALNATVVTKSVSCSGSCDGKAWATITGGTSPYTYLWMPGGFTTDTIKNLCAGNGYSLKITDANGCSVTVGFSITQPTPLSVSVTSTTSSCNICNGSASVTAVGGTSPYTYTWSNGQSTANATTLCIGTYTVTITDAGGCTATKAITINPTVNLIITSSAGSVSCFNSCDGTATANASGGASPYIYSWNPSGETTQTATGLCSGITYTVTATDINGCFNTSTVSFINPPQLVISPSQTNISCNGNCNGTATATVTGGTGAYTYSWVPGGQTTASVSGLCIGTYKITVKDSKGCSAIDSVKIIQAPPIADNPTVVKSDCSLSDGSISLSPSGGVPGYTYVWLPGGQTTSSISGITAGIYTVTITDASGCAKVFQIAVGNVTGPALTGGVTPVSCNGSCNGTANVSASGGNPPYVYSWSPGGQTTTSISNLCAGLYIAKVTDASGCISYDTITVTSPLKISPNATVVPPSCNGDNNGSITFTPTGGTPTYTYVWTPSVSVTSTANNLTSGTYSVTITDSKGCDSAITINITQPVLLSVTITSTNVTCFGSCNGKATANVTGGTGAYTYSWSTGATLSSVVNLCPATYTVTVKDANGCTATQQVIITQPVLLTSSVVSTNVSCNLTCDGTATVTASGGKIPYTYSWSPGAQTTASISNLCAGSYAVTVTDANGCTSQDSVKITQPAKINITIPNGTVSCNGSCDGIANSVTTGGTTPYTYSWSNGQTTQNATALCPSTYTLTVTDVSGCSASQSVTINNPAVLFANTSQTNPSCVGSCNATASSSPTGGTAPYTYSWLPGNQTTPAISGLCAGTYTLVVKDAHSCIDSSIVTIVNPATITITPATASANCGTCNGTIAITATGGTTPYTYSWAPGGQTTANVNSLCAGIYTVTVTSANGCTSSLAIPLSNSTGPTGDSLVSKNVSCNGNCNGTISDFPKGGVLPYSYLWTPGGQTINTVSNICAGKYFIKVTDANGCIRIDSLTITQPGVLTATPTIVKASCAGVCNGSITLIASGGTNPYTYTWNTGQTTAAISNLCPGKYVYTVTDANACTYKDSVMIVPITVLTAPVSVTSAGCNGTCNGTATVTPSGGAAPYIFQWNDPESQTSATATALCAGNYTVTITDANGCTATGLATIIQNAAITANPTVIAATCGMCNGQITLAPSGGTAPYTYTWSSGQTTASVNNLCAGVYDVSITDNKGCISNTTITINNSGGPNIVVASTNATCNGTCNGTATATASGGSLPYTYLWIPGGQTTASVNNLCAGTYNVEVRDSAGCSTIKTVVISSNPAFVMNQNVTSTTCGSCNGSISVNPTGGVTPYTFSWAPGAQTTATINSLCARTYTVTVTDASGCSQTFAIPVSNPTGPTVTISTTNVTCNGSCNGTATAIASGGASPYTYSWSNGQTTSSANGLCAGNYSVKVTDNAGCVRALIFTITAPAPISFSAPFVMQPKCNNNCNGIITVIPSGGTMPYTYVWTPNVSTTATASNLCAGSYSVTVSDANGCPTPQQIFVLINPAVLTISHTSVNTTCNTVNNGSITETVGGGTPPYSFQWSGSSTATTQSLTNILPGDYILTVTDASGCTIMDSAKITSAITTLVSAGNDTSFCQSGKITLKATGNVAGLTYTWFQLPAGTLVGNTQSVTVNPPSGSTTYEVVATNGSCPDTSKVIVTSNPLPTVNPGTNQTIVIYTSVTLGGNPTAPAGSTYSWQPTKGLSDSTSSNPVATPLTTTTYTVTVTNASGCSVKDSVTITVIPEISFPNGITPNGDGKNDTWIIDNIQYFPKCLVEIYNRWGELLFSSPGYVTKWDGTYQGKPLPVGTYYYIINLNDPRFPNVYTGPITILR